jgi:hypothetical protein
MLNRIAIRYFFGDVEVHFAIHNRDLSICGHDLIGDDDWEGMGEVNKPVNCPDCLELVKACKQIKLKKQEQKKIKG